MCKDGSWTLGALVPEEPRWRVLEAESALEAFGEPDSTSSAGCAFLIKECPVFREASVRRNRLQANTGRIDPPAIRHAPSALRPQRLSGMASAILSAPWKRYTPAWRSQKENAPSAPYLD